VIGDPESHKIAACQGKEKLTRELAFTVAKRQRQNHEHHIEAYHCKLCGHYHTGRPLVDNRAVAKVRDVQHPLVAHPNRAAARRQQRWKR
jgi:hypothetical protein